MWIHTLVLLLVGVAAVFALDETNAACADCAALKVLLEHALKSGPLRDQQNGDRRKLGIEDLSDVLLALLLQHMNRRQLQISDLPEDILAMLASLVDSVDTMQSELYNSTVALGEEIQQSAANTSAQISASLDSTQAMISDEAEGFKAGVYNYMNSFIIGITVTVGVVFGGAVLYLIWRCWRQRKAGAKAGKVN